MRARTIGFVLAVAAATAGVPGSAAARDLGALSDMLALAFLNDEVLKSCQFGRDGHGNLLRSAATYYRERIEKSVLDGLEANASLWVVRAAQVKAEDFMNRLDRPAAGRTEAIRGWCATRGETVVELVARTYQARHRELQAQVVAATE